MTTWSSRPRLNPNLVARALSDQADLPSEKFNPEAVPTFNPPKAVRPCCALGMDLKAKVGEAPVPGYKNGNILGTEDLGPHGYDQGLVPGENNGLVYTCRGGFIDMAHIRDNADRTLYLAMQIARQLPAGFTLELPEEGTLRRVIIKPLPSGLLSHAGRWQAAVTLAQWINYQLSIWHEISTWYGWQSIKGVSERLSAFSPEDMYSNIVGQRIAAGIVLNQEAESREDYDRAMNAWIPETLRRLGAVSKVDGRRAMQSVDGLWWDSKQRVPDFKLVTRRNLGVASPVSGWLVTDAVPRGLVHDELKQMCSKQPAPLPLAVVDRLGDQKIDELVTIVFEFSSWLAPNFPVPAEKGKTFTQAQFPEIIKAIRADGEKELGPDFDKSHLTKASEGPLVSSYLPTRQATRHGTLRVY